MRLFDDLGSIARDHPVAQRKLVCRTRGEGRELMRALTHRGVPWAGLEVATPRSLALAAASDGLAEAGLDPIDEFEETAFLDEAIDAILRDSGSGSLAALAEGVGFREALANAIQALRLAGVGPDDVAKAGIGDRAKQKALAAILRTYEGLLDERKRIDSAGIFARGIEAVESGAVDGTAVLLAPGLPAGGLSGRFLDRLREAGTRSLVGDPVLGLESPAGRTWPAPETTTGRLSHLFDVAAAPPDLADPAIELFRAASPAEEVREVLRRIVERGLGWDEVEIVATEPVAYGAALDEIATRLVIPVTYAVGLPIERSRAGRAARAYLKWIERDFPDQVLRGLLSAGDLEPPGRDGERPSGGRLARRLQRLRVGWGRERYGATIAVARRRLERPLEVTAEEEAEDPDARERKEREREREAEELDALEALLGPVLAATPPTPDRLGRGGGRVAPADLARGLTAFLAFVPIKGDIEAEAKGRLLDRLARVEATLVRPTGFATAATILARHLELRIPSPGAEGPPPWGSTGGHLHLADLEHGGRTGRAETFVVGLDADRFPGAGLQDPILHDADRRRMGASGLPSAVEVVEEKQYALASMLAGLRGRVTLSWSAWDAASGREVAPGAVLLQAFRLREGKPHATYEDLRKAVGGLACPVPRRGAVLDATDVWLDALTDGGELRRGEALVLEAFPGLARGVEAREARRSEAFTAYDGRIVARPEVLDPRVAGFSLSSSRLEQLGECPLAYLHRNVLGIEKPDDPELDPGTWLDAKERGRLLHSVYEESLEEARSREVPLADPAFGDIARERLDRLVARYREIVPVPSETVYEDEKRDLVEGLKTFLHMITHDPPDWLDTERTFGFVWRGEAPIPMDVAGGTIRTHGVIDRVDDLGDGLRIVDYKTGSTYGYGGSDRIWNGGRRLQHAIYANAARILHGKPVREAAYHFPTQKGSEDPYSYAVLELADAPRVLGALLDLVAAGHFVPTNEPDDCKYCDYKTVCRVEVAGWEIESPPADWGKKAAAAELDECARLVEVRGIEKAEK